jgi:UDP-GlcNAc:undecaprenyl-phosphate GlcNAc-1-phosphate transferase
VILLLTLLSIIIFFLVFNSKQRVAQKLGLIDKPDNKLKQHKKNTPVIGGIILLSSALLTIVALYFLKELFYIKIIFLAIICSIIGLIDDIFKIPPNKKILFLSLIIFFYLIIFNKQIIQFLVIEYNGPYVISLIKKEYLAVVFTILCYLLLINAYNMCDGQDGIALYVGIFWFIYFFFFKTTYIFLSPIMASLILLFIFNIQSKLYLGDSGNYFISVLFGSLIINYNNLSNNIFTCEEIFILFMLPGVDMLRLFIERILKKKNPLHGDREHFHHLLHNKFGKRLTTLIYFLFFTIPILLYKSNVIPSYYIIIISIIIYMLTIRIIKK